MGGAAASPAYNAMRSIAGRLPADTEAGVPPVRAQWHSNETLTSPEGRGSNMAANRAVLVGRFVVRETRKV